MRSVRPAFFFFDLGNVLFHFDHQRAVRQLARLVGRSPETVNRVLFDSGLQCRYETGLLDTRQMYETLCDGLDLESRPPVDQLLCALSDIFSLNISIVPLVVQMVGAGCRLGILSNTCEAHWRFLVDKPFTILRTHFDFAVLSYEVHSMKPDPAIYAHAARRAGVPPARLFFVDDKPENVLGARQAGWQTHCFRSPAMLAAALRAVGVALNY